MLPSDIRILKIVTVSVNLEDAPASLARRYYFVLQLFKEQIFYMEPHLETILALALAWLRSECCENKEKYIGKYGKIEYEGWDEMLESVHQRWHVLRKDFSWEIDHIKASSSLAFENRDGQKVSTHFL